MFQYCFRRPGERLRDEEKGRTGHHALYSLCANTKSNGSRSDVRNTQSRTFEATEETKGKAPQLANPVQASSLPGHASNRC